MATFFARTTGGCDLLKMLNIAYNNAGTITSVPASLVAGVQEHRPLQPPCANCLAGSCVDMSSQMEEDLSETATEEEDVEPSEVVADE